MKREKRMKREERDGLYEVYSKLGAGWLELAQVIDSMREGEEHKDELKEAKAKIKEGLTSVFLSLEVPLE
jgi:predicted Zn-dependent peptidase